MEPSEDLKSKSTTTLASLPPELLNDFTRRCYGHSIVRLYMCGSKALNDRLCRLGGVTEVELQGISFVPALLAQFEKLSYLKLHEQCDCYDIEQSFQCGSTSMPSLRALELHTPDILTLLDSFDCNALFPNLESLVIVSFSAASPKDDLCRRLPVSLKRFVSPLQIKPEQLALLPRGLKLLETCLSDEPYTGNWADLLPKGLVSLRANGASVYKLLEYLPPTLLSLNANVLDETDIDEVADMAKLCAALPRELQSLQLSLGYLSFSNALPPYLKVLTLYCNGRTKLSYLANLPATLESLMVRGSMSIEPSEVQPFIESLPSSLTMLFVQKLDSFYTTSSVKKLPSSLKNFESSNFDEQWIPLLPPGLTSLNISGWADSSPPETEREKLWQALEKLEKLEILRFVAVSPLIGSIPLLRFLPRGLKQLYPTITEEEGMETWTSEFGKFFRLEIFNLSHDMVTLSAAFFHALPRCLKKLAIKGSVFDPDHLVALHGMSSLEKLQIARLKSSLKDSHFQDFAKSFPNLQDLTLVGVPATDLTLALFDILPKSLHALALPESPLSNAKPERAKLPRLHYVE